MSLAPGLCYRISLNFQITIHIRGNYYSSRKISQCCFLFLYTFQLKIHEYVLIFLMKMHAYWSIFMSTWKMVEICTRYIFEYACKQIELINLQQKNCFSRVQLFFSTNNNLNECVYNHFKLFSYILEFSPRSFGWVT